MTSRSWTSHLLLALALWAPRPAAAQSSAPAERLDINRATVEEFASLKGIGLSRAAALVRMRERNGPFRQVEELRALPRLPETVFLQLRDQVMVNPAPVALQPPQPGEETPRKPPTSNR